MPAGEAVTGAEMGEAAGFEEVPLVGRWGRGAGLPSAVFGGTGQAYAKPYACSSSPPPPRVACLSTVFCRAGRCIGAGSGPFRTPSGRRGTLFLFAQTLEQLRRCCLAATTRRRPAPAGAPGAWNRKMGMRWVWVSSGPSVWPGLPGWLGELNWVLAQVIIQAFAPIEGQGRRVGHHAAAVLVEH